MLYVQIAGCVVSGVQSIMYYCGSAGAPSWVDCAGAETLPLVVDWPPESPDNQYHLNK